MFNRRGSSSTFSSKNYLLLKMYHIKSYSFKTRKIAICGKAKCREQYRFFHNATYLEDLKMYDINFIERVKTDSKERYKEGETYGNVQENSANVELKRGYSQCSRDVIPKDCKYDIYGKHEKYGKYCKDGEEEEDLKYKESPSSSNPNEVQKNRETIKNKLIYELLTGKENESERIYYLLEFLSNEKCNNNNNFSTLFMITKMYKNVIMKKDKARCSNTKIINYVKESINFVTHYYRYHDYLFKCFELLCIFNISDIKLYQKVLYLILKHSTNEETNIISCYYIIKHLYSKKLYNKLIGNLLAKYLMRKSFFNFLEKQNCVKSSFLIFLNYIIHSNVCIISHDVLQKYVHYFSDVILVKHLEYKNVSNVNELIEFQNILLTCNFYNDKLNSLIKKYIQTFLNTIISPFDMLLLSSNLLLSFTRNDHILIFPNKKCPNYFSEIPSEGEKMINNVTQFNQNYRNFLCMKTLANTVVRTNDNYISNVNTNTNLDYILRYFVLSSYCHFTLFSNWWSDTSIYWKLKKKKKKKTILRERLPYKNHLREKITHLLNVILYKYKYSKKASQNNVEQEEQNALLENQQERKNIKEENELQLLRYKYVPYLFKSLVRISIFNSNFIRSEPIILLFENLFLDCVNAYITNYEMERGKNYMNTDNSATKNDQRKLGHSITYTNCTNNEISNIVYRLIKTHKQSDLLENYNLSLYEISSICECSFLLKYLQEKEMENMEVRFTLNTSVDIFEKTLYMFLDKISIKCMNTKLNHFILNRHYLHNILLHEYVNYGNAFFKYYLLLRVILPLLFSDSLSECLSVTRRTLVHIMSFLFVSKLSSCSSLRDDINETAFDISRSRNNNSNINSNINSNNNHTSNNANDNTINSNSSSNSIILNNYIKWENSIISINNQRRIRKKTKTKRFLLDFIYAGELMRPTSIYIMCLFQITKYDDMYDYFLRDVLKTDYITPENKTEFSIFINKLSASTNVSIRRILNDNRKKKKKKYKKPNTQVHTAY
ncbi:conserved Plasmodium protein, unknown function [Plasmodium malariae]|uniref:Uncharacterized protein n=1 Tax=Plasmodium malariae TaxID=5858 RepID=A0A1C3KLG9_PLAMA|nr:conserved Plasmodium protein, unknown function [Plasmodium malariae]